MQIVGCALLPVAGWRPWARLRQRRAAVWRRLKAAAFAFVQSYVWPAVGDFVGDADCWRSPGQSRRAWSSAEPCPSARPDIPARVCGQCCWCAWRLSRWRKRVRWPDGDCNFGLAIGEHWCLAPQGVRVPSLPAASAPKRPLRRHLRALWNGDRAGLGRAFIGTDGQYTLDNYLRTPQGGGYGAELVHNSTGGGMFGSLRPDWALNDSLVFNLTTETNGAGAAKIRTIYRYCS